MGLRAVLDAVEEREISVSIENWASIPGLFNLQLSHGIDYTVSAPVLLLI
jgi:hypothetical protein